MKAILRQTRISSKKANLVAALVRGKRVEEAVDTLKFTPKKGARILKKLIESAAANAENNFKQNKTDLYIKEIIVNEGSTYKRSVAISRGRTHPVLKRTAHIRVELGAGDREENREASKKSESTKEPTKKPTDS